MKRMLLLAAAALMFAASSMFAQTIRSDANSVTISTQMGIITITGATIPLGLEPIYAPVPGGGRLDPQVHATGNGPVTVSFRPGGAVANAQLTITQGANLTWKTTKVNWWDGWWIDNSVPLSGVLLPPTPNIPHLVFGLSWDQALTSALNGAPLKNYADSFFLYFL